MKLYKNIYVHSGYVHIGLGASQDPGGGWQIEAPPVGLQL